MQVWNVTHVARLKYRMQKLHKKSPSVHHHTILLGCIFATKVCIDNRKNLLNSNISSTCPHNMVNFGPLTVENGLPVWRTPANFNGFRVLASLMHWRRSMEVNQTLHDVWPSPGLLHYIYIFGGSSCPLTEFCQVQNSLCIQVLRAPILAALLHGIWAVGISQTLWCGIFTWQGSHPVRHWVVELSSYIYITCVIIMQIWIWCRFNVDPTFCLLWPTDFWVDVNKYLVQQLKWLWNWHISLTSSVSPCPPPDINIRFHA